MQFCPKEFERFLDNNSFETRNKWKDFSRDQLFVPRFNLSLREQKDLALKRLHIVSQNKVFSVEDFVKNPLNVFANHEMASWVDGSLATKLTVQYNLFGGTLFTLGTQRHLKVATGVDTLKTIGCFALTELGYGNNAVQMETTSTWDPATKEFIINSPSQLSQKYWITNGALHCNYAIVFAQLLYNQKTEGVHAFLVKIRNDDGSVCQGIEIEDMGAKFGLNGVDNGRLRFTQVRVPRESLLNKYSEMDEQGNFSSQIKNKRDRFLKVADRLLSGRLCIASMSIGSTKFGLTTAIRYASKRMAVGKAGKSDNPIINFNLFQNQVYPLLAKTLILNTAFTQIKILYANSLLNKEEATPFLVCLCCVIKPLITWNARDVATCLIERVGGQGYLSVNRLAELMPSAHSGITAEGDNSVLMQKVSKELIGLVMKNKYQSPEPKNSRESIAQLKELNNIETLIDLIRLKEIQHLQDTINMTQTQMQDGKDIYEIWMEKENAIIQELAKSFGERVVTDFAYQMISQARQDIKQPLLQYLKLYLLNIVYTHSGWFIVNGYINREAAAFVEKERNNTIYQIHQIAYFTVNSFGIPEHLLNAPIAQDYEAYNAQPNEGELVRARL